MNRRRLETVIAWITLCALVIYVPGETYVSWPGGLLNPFYLVDAIAMILMLWGALHSLSARPRCAPGVLCGAYGWAAANGWRSTFWRWAELQSGGELDYGDAEFWVVAVATALAVILFMTLLVLTAQLRTPIHQPPNGSSPLGP
jgi:hypothetical protein